MSSSISTNSDSLTSHQGSEPSGRVVQQVASSHPETKNARNASMTDLAQILPDFPTADYVRILPPLERAHVTTSDLITQNVTEIAKRARLPLLDLKRLCDAVLEALQSDLKEDTSLPKTISTLDETLDKTLGGGVPTGYITEVTGERYVLKLWYIQRILLIC